MGKRVCMFHARMYYYAMQCKRKESKSRAIEIENVDQIKSALHVDSGMFRIENWKIPNSWILCLVKSQTKNSNEQYMQFRDLLNTPTNHPIYRPGYGSKFEKWVESRNRAGTLSSAQATCRSAPLANIGIVIGHVLGLKEIRGRQPNVIAHFTADY
jgi:hypothetical protein